MSVSISVHKDEKLARIVREIALEGYTGPEKHEWASLEKYKWLRDTGSRLWLDTGDESAAQNVWGAEVEALTTNNTLVNQVVRTGLMDGVIAYAARRIKAERPDIGEQDLIMEIGFLVNARLALQLVQKFGAHVSVELHPDIGFDVESTLVFGRRYYEINPDFFYVKVPLTPDGFIGARKLSQECIPVNYTLGFSARQNYLAARFSHPAFVNIFLGRLNQVVEDNGLGSPENIGEKATLASNEIITELREANSGIGTRQIAASLRSGAQVLALAGVDVLTIPPKAAAQYLELNISEKDIVAHNWQDLEVNLNADIPYEFDRLWEVDDKFLNFVEDAVVGAERMTAGSDLMELSMEHGVDLFYDWTPEDRQKLGEKGKIPDVSQWPGVPIDDLMSMSALESFAKDQMELDARIFRIIKES